MSRGHDDRGRNGSVHRNRIRGRNERSSRASADRGSAGSSVMELPAGRFRQRRSLRILPCCDTQQGRTNRTIGAKKNCRGGNARLSKSRVSDTVWSNGRSARQHLSGRATADYGNRAEKVKATPPKSTQSVTPVQGFGTKVAASSTAPAEPSRSAPRARIPSATV